MLVIETTAWVVLVAWLLLVLLPARRWPDELQLGEDRPPPTRLRGEVVALVPARDEAEILPSTLPTLLAQCPPLAAVVLVDDGSTDGTAEVARLLAAEASAVERLRVVAASQPPRGWTGKLHALACGWRTIEREWGERVERMLVTDADIAHRPGSVAALLAVADGGPGDTPPAGEGGTAERDLVSVMARLRAESFWERLLVPPFVYFFHLLYPFRRVSSPGSRVAAAAGGCMLLGRRALERTGGFAAIRSAVIDDVALARLVRDRGRVGGGRLWLGFDPGIRSLRSYRSLRSLWRMVARSAFVQLRYRWDLLAAVLVSLAVAVIAPAALALGVGAAWIGGFGVPAALGRAAVAAGAIWSLQTASVLPFVRHHRVPAVFAATLPLAAALYAAMTLSSALAHARRRGVAWKGRIYG